VGGELEVLVGDVIGTADERHPVGVERKIEDELHSLREKVSDR
jgi:hypothetical protein